MGKTDILFAAALGALLATQARADDGAAAPAQQGAEQPEMGDIVVTAQGRAQAAQDVPLAVAVIDPQLIQNAGIVDVRGLRQLTPSLQVTTGQSAATGVVITIRGVGTASDNPGFEPAVGVFIDGVFRARAGLTLTEFPELERVEVLRGPQGTLFGRNTSAGALNIITAGPKFDFGGYAEASYGNADEIELKAGVTAPVAEHLALRVDAGYHKRDGYSRDVNSDRRFNDLNRYFVRGQALYEDGGLKIRLIGDYAETDEQCCIAIHTEPGTTGPIIDGLAALAGREGIITPVDIEKRLSSITPARDLKEKVKDWGFSGQIDLALGDFNLTSISAYRDWRALRNQDIDFTGLDRTYREGYRTAIRDITQEVRLQGTVFDGTLDFMVGGFYLDERLKLRDTIRFGAQAGQYVDALLGAATAGLSPLAPNGFSLYGSLPGRPFLGNAFLANPQVQALIAQNPALLPQFTNFLPSPVGTGQYSDNFEVDTRAIGLFTHNIVNLTDALSLTIGLRYNHERKKIRADLNGVNAPCTALLPGGASAVFGQVLAANARFDPIRLLVCNPTINAEFNGDYADSHSESELTGTARLAYKLTPDVLMFAGYAHGYKSGGYNLDRGGFDSTYFGGNGAQLSDLSFGKETADSFEAGIKTNLSRAFQLNITGFYQDFSGYQSLRFEGSSFVVRQFDKVISKGVELESIIRPSGNVSVNLGYTYLHTVVDDPLHAGDDDGKQATNQPRHVVTSAFTWTPPITDTLSGLVHVDARFNSDSNTLNAPGGIASTTNDAYVLVNARLGLDFDEGRFGIEAYVENVFDVYYNILGFPVPEQIGAYAVYPSPPRFYGVRLRTRF
ncbi:outer membrane receptor protein involved in Fe transport [Sphingomonas zeicaulis]|uniref:TonB-dependent receptor n=1 Tax=Sphingomonas zeicaulis TaxID=1632740 RepID=UPI003D253C1A